MIMYVGKTSYDIEKALIQEMKADSSLTAILGQNVFTFEIPKDKLPDNFLVLLPIQENFANDTSVLNVEYQLDIYTKVRSVGNSVKKIIMEKFGNFRGKIGTDQIGVSNIGVYPLSTVFEHDKAIYKYKEIMSIKVKTI